MMAFWVLAFGSLGSMGGVMMAEEIHCPTTTSTGSTQYAPAASHPMGGWPSTRGHSQEMPAPGEGGRMGGGEVGGVCVSVDVV